MAKLSKNHKKLHGELEDIYNPLDTLLEDETMKSFPKAFEKLKDKLGDIIQSIEDGDYEEEEVEEDKEDMDGEKDAD
jgi:regulator of replication initiation timing